MVTEQNISYIIPAFNCQSTLEQSVESIFNENFLSGDEVLICDDASSDFTSRIMNDLKRKFNCIRLLYHKSNRGGGACRNTLVCESSNPLIFCLDSDNILKKNSIPKLKEYFFANKADMAAFSNVHFFSQSPEHVEKILKYSQSSNPIQDYFEKIDVPGGDGNYLYKKSAWEKVGGYPEFAFAMDTWGFGFRMAAEGFKSVLLNDEFYYHRFGHGSYWDRCKGLPVSLIALQIILPYLKVVEERDAKYILNNPTTWYRNIQTRPIKVRKHFLANNSMLGSRQPFYQYILSKFTKIFNP